MTQDIFAGQYIAEKHIKNHTIQVWIELNILETQKNARYLKIYNQQKLCR